MNTAEATPQFEIMTSRQFQNWLYGQRASIVFTTYQIGKIFMLGTNPDGKLHVTERTFNRAMGLGYSGNTLWMSSLYQMWRFENSLPAGQQYNGYDRVFIPQMAYTTGDLDIHDVIIQDDGTPIFCNTLFSCLATVSQTHSFKPIWKPDFITQLAPEDRCHLNGLAGKDGKPAYVTAVSKSNVSDGWRDRRNDGGIVIDVQTNEIVCEGLSMPHSPRWHNGKLWLLEAGTGYFGYVNLETKSFERVTFCPGFLRGMGFIGNYAVVGISSARKNKTFSGLQLDENLQKENVDARCGIQIINLETGATEQWIRLKGIIDELYDVHVMPNVIRPLIIGTKKDEVRTMISIEQ
ncbi:MAG: TIGR03032 family protein [Bacteroidota bacterium]